MITVRHLTKCYGDFIAVDDLSFDIEEGHVYGFLGPNGAGKSTTMNIMTGCLSATEGHVRINGYDIFEEADQAKKLIGYLPEFPPLYMNETPIEYLRFVGEAKGLKGKELETQIEEVISQTKLFDVKKKLISKLSKGYKQRVGIAQALLGNPKVIILDEPTVGLDPIQIIEIRDLIRQLGQSHTVILSSHILSEVQAICEKVLIIAKGKLVAFDEPKNLKNLLLGADGISFVAETTEVQAAEILNGIEQITEWECKEAGEGSIKICVQVNNSDLREISRKLFFAFAQKEKAILEMTTQKVNLEDIFIELTEEEAVNEANGEEPGTENPDSEESIQAAIETGIFENKDLEGGVTDK